MEKQKKVEKYYDKLMTGKGAKAIINASQKQQENLKKIVIKGDIYDPEALLDYGFIRTYIPTNYAEHDLARLECFYVQVDKGYKSAPHVHPTFDQLILVVGGEGKLYLSGKLYDLHKGIIHHILAGQWHSFDTSESDSMLEVFYVSSPPLTLSIRAEGFEGFSEADWEKMGYRL